MAGEIQFAFGAANATCYVLIRPASSGDMVWRGSMSGFAQYATGSYSGYPVSVSPQGTVGAYYIGNFPNVIPPGVYNVVAKRQMGSDPSEADPNIAAGEIQWNGSKVVPISDLVTSGQAARFLPVRMSRVNMVRNFGIYLVQAADHITPLTSGVVSGQVMRDGGAWGPLQSGAFTEAGNGYYNLQALTSGDLDADTISLLFNAVTVSGIVSDPLPMSFILQRSSGG